MNANSIVYTSNTGYTAGKGLAEKQDRTPGEDVMLEMMTKGGSRVSAENLAEVLAWVEKE